MSIREESPRESTMGSGVGIVPVLALLVLVAAVPLRAEPKPHPSLLNAASTKCLTCHRAVGEQAHVHEPVSTCSTCHEFSGERNSTRVNLTAQQPALCTNCHDDKGPAAKGELTASHPPVTGTCTSCHDPHGSSNARFLRAAAPKLCLECHDGAGLDASHKVSVSRADCGACHDPHGSAFPKALRSDRQHAPFTERSCNACHRRGLRTRSADGRAPDVSKTCFACHEADAFRAKAVHTAVTAGQCTGCHDPHLALEPKLLRRAGRSLCASCHDAIESKLSQASTHTPAGDDCSTCHAAHAGEHRNQLTDTVPALCLTCHDGSDAALAAKHLGASMTSLDCLTCHDAHGSPRQPLIASQSVHAPFADSGCASCHQGSAGKLVENGSRVLCFACHADLEESIKAAKVKHGALDAVECSECHQPHASAQRKLVKLPAGGTCLACHDDKAAAGGEQIHGAIREFGCEACHDPHGGDRAKLLRDDADQLCLACHDAGRWTKSSDGFRVTLAARFELSAAEAKKIRTLRMIGADPEHPIAAHRALGTPTEKELAGTKTSFRGALSCLTCHDPHKGKSRQLFTAGKSSPMEVCLACHEK